MTRKDYVAIAASLHANLNEYTSVVARQVVKHAAGAIADVLAADNVRFNRDRFMLAVTDGAK